MYVALFLFPWMLMYGLARRYESSSSFASSTSGGAPFEKERELAYDGVLPEGRSCGPFPRSCCNRGLDGAHTSRTKDGRSHHPERPAGAERLTYTPADRALRSNGCRFAGTCC